MNVIGGESDKEVSFKGGSFRLRDRKIGLKN